MHAPAGRRHGIRVLPETELGRLAVTLAVLNIVLLPAWTLLPGGGALGLACGLAGGVAALVAILRRGERAVAVFAAVVPLVFVLAFLVAEVVVPH